MTFIYKTWMYEKRRNGRVVRVDGGESVMFLIAVYAAGALYADNAHRQVCVIVERWSVVGKGTVGGEHEVFNRHVYRRESEAAAQGRPLEIEHTLQRSARVRKATQKTRAALREIVRRGPGRSRR
jgi:hypothetical protein